MPVVPPTPGVSTIDPNGRRAPLVDGPSPRSSRPAQARGGDPLQHILDAKKSESLAPVGVKQGVQDVIEIPIRTRKSRRGTVTIASADGKNYTFQTRGPKGQPLPHVAVQCLYIALHEIALTGDPAAGLRVFDAFKVRIDDFDEQRYYPRPNATEAPPEEEPPSGVKFGGGLDPEDE